MRDDDALILDCGAKTYFAARHSAFASQHLTGTGMLASMASGLSFAIAAQLAFPQRQSIAVAGDGGFAQLMAELSTAVAYQLPVKIVVLKNNSLGEVSYEQMEIGNPEFGCTLSPIDFVAFAKSCGADGFRCERPDEVRPAIEAALRSPKAASVEAVVANENAAPTVHHPTLQLGICCPSTGLPTMAVLPSADSATDHPWWELPTESLPASFAALLCPDTAAAGEDPRMPL